MRGVIAVFIVFLISFPQLAAADDVSKRVLAEKLVMVMNLEPQIKSMREAIKHNYMQGLEQTSGIHKSELTKLAGVISGIVDEVYSWEEMKGEYSVIHVELYTEDELRDMFAFFKSATGQAYFKKAQALSDKLMESMQTRGALFESKTGQRTIEFLEGLKKEAGVPES